MIAQQDWVIISNHWLATSTNHQQPHALDTSSTTILTLLNNQLILNQTDTGRAEWLFRTVGRNALSWFRQRACLILVLSLFLLPYLVILSASGWSKDLDRNFKVHRDQFSGCTWQCGYRQQRAIGSHGTGKDNEWMACDTMRHCWVIGNT